MQVWCLSRRRRCKQGGRAGLTSKLLAPPPCRLQVRNMMYGAGVPWKLAFYPPGTAFAGNYSALAKFGIPYNASLPMYTNDNPAEKHCVWWSVNSK